MENRKIVIRDGMDQISKLPDDVLVRILSVVPTEQAVTTSLLSKRWKFLWTLLPELDFDYVSLCKSFNIVFEDHKKERFRGFLEFVDYVFVHHQVEHLQRLRFAFDIAQRKNYSSDKIYASEVRRLVKLAMRCNCLTLELQFSNPSTVSYPTYHGMYTLPPCISFPHRSVTHLKLTNCKLIASLYKSFLSVKILKITVVELRKDSVNDLVSKCSCLEELHIIRCKFPSYSFELNSPESNLKCLVLQIPNDEVFSHVSLHVPSLSRFKYEGASCYPSINNAENVIEAEIKMVLNKSNEHMFLCNLLKNLSNVKVLMLCFRYLEVLDTNGGTSLLTPLCNLKHLSIKSWRFERELMSLMCLLRNSPYLETLSIDLHCGNEGLEHMPFSLYRDRRELTILEPLLLPSDRVLHLTKIDIKNFQGLKVEVEFVRIMLQSSLCLKEMVICISSRYEHLKQRLELLDKVLQKKKNVAVENILACTCSSPDAQLLIK
ncbi:hypothetical protein MKX03_028941 [Papaver bracteatum]|nr:hypothetical protein MKX03_028941 [Papaver bracteatum]